MKHVQDQGTWNTINDQMGMDALSSFSINKTEFQSRKKSTIRILQMDL